MVVGTIPLQAAKEKKMDVDQNALQPSLGSLVDGHDSKQQPSEQPIPGPSPPGLDGVAGSSQLVLGSGQ